MTRTTRRVIFYGFVLIFIIVTPLTILYTSGYSFDLQKMALTQTGGIYLKSTPSGAQVALDGKANKTTPKLLPRLLPRQFNVSISQDGFYGWNKKLDVTAGLVTEARNIFLFPKQIDIQPVQNNVTSTIYSFLSSFSQKEKFQQARQTASTTKAWTLKDDTIFYLSDNLALFKSDLNGISQTQLSKEGLPVDSYRIIVGGNGNQVMTLAQKGNLYLLDNNGVLQKIGNQIKNAEFSSDNKKILMLADNEINVLYLEDILIQPYKKAGDKELIIRSPQKISDAIFYPNNEYIAFAVNDQIKIIELDGRDQRNTVDLLEVSSPQIYFDQDNGYFYYLSAGNLFRFKISN